MSDLKLSIDEFLRKQRGRPPKDSKYTYSCELTRSAGAYSSQLWCNWSSSHAFIVTITWDTRSFDILAHDQQLVEELSPIIEAFIEDNP